MSQSHKESSGAKRNQRESRGLSYKSAQKIWGASNNCPSVPSDQNTDPKVIAVRTNQQKVNRRRRSQEQLRGIKKSMVYTKTWWVAAA